MKIISTFVLTPEQRSLVQQASGGGQLVDRNCRSIDEIGQLLDDSSEILLTFRVPHGIAQRAPQLKWIQLLSAGADHALNGALAHHEPGVHAIRLTTASGIHATPIAEYVMASMLAYVHRLHDALRAQIRGEWMMQGEFMAKVDELRGKTVAIIGYGSIGRETARLAQAFGMEVVALKRDPSTRADPGWIPKGLGDPQGTIPRRFCGPDERQAALAESDFVVVTLPLTSETRKFLGAREFATFKPGAYLVNIGRGEVIDQQAMIEALRQGRLAGAGLDVFEHEPLEPESPLWGMEQVILTPHISGATRSYMDKACELFADNLKRYHAGRPLLNLIDRELGY